MSTHALTPDDVTKVAARLRDRPEWEQARYRRGTLVVPDALDADVEAELTSIRAGTWSPPARTPRLAERVATLEAEMAAFKSRSQK